MCVEEAEALIAAAPDRTAAEQARDLYAEACAQDHPDACNGLAVTLAVQLEDRAAALEPAKKACALDQAQGCTNAWHLMPESAGHARWRMAYKACGLGNDEGCGVLRPEHGLDGHWTLVGTLNEQGEVVALSDRIAAEDSRAVWAAERWHFEQGKLEAHRYVGFFVAAEYWVTEASLTGAYALDGNVLTFQASSSTHAAFTVDGVASIAIPYSLPERAHLLKHWELRARSCTSGAACRDSVVVRFPSGALGIMDPVSDAIDLDQEVPW